MKYIKIILIAFLLVSLSAVSSQAKWWIFGQSQDEISIKYLYLNKTPFEESTEKITLYKDSLKDNLIHIRGKATIKSGQIADVRISLNDKETWQTAELSKDGAFSYGFTPESDKTYIVYVEITDTRGKTNDIESTRKEVTLSDNNVMAVIRTTVDAMIEAYKNEDARAFMSYVSNDFAGDDTVLDRAIRQDFTFFDNIDLRYTLNTLSTDSKGMIFVSLTYNRFLISSKDGMSHTDRGTTEFVFQLGNEHPLVYSMKNPLIFGLSNAAEVATGTIMSTGNEPIIIVDDRGNISTGNIDEVIDAINHDDDVDDNVESGSVTLVSAGHPPMGFDFSDGDVITGDGDFVITGGDVNYGYGFLDAGVLIQDLGDMSLNDVTEAPSTSYTNGTAGAIELYEGHVYAFQLSGTSYGLLYVRSVSADFSSGLTITLHLDYKYRGDGSRTFQ